MGSMATYERRSDRATRDGKRVVADLAREFRTARVNVGLSQSEVGRALGVSRERISRFERGADSDPGLLFLVRLFAVVALSLTARAWPDGSPRRDRAHANLISALVRRLHPSARWRTEVPLPNPGDKRAWDAVIGVAGVRIGVEAETRPRDGQELHRRLQLKLRDGGVDHLLLVLSDTRANREFQDSWATEVRADFPVAAVAMLAAIDDGRDPGGSGIVLIRDPQPARR